MNALEQAVHKAFCALQVISLDRRIAANLASWDPNALRQVREAIDAVEVAKGWGRSAEARHFDVPDLPNFNLEKAVYGPGYYWGADLTPYFPRFDNNKALQAWLAESGVYLGRLDGEQGCGYYRFATRRDGERFFRKLVRYICDGEGCE